MKIVGYLINEQEGLVGEPGLFYNYILAGNGLLVKGQSPLMTAQVLIAPAEVRGLAHLEEALILQHGKIPRHLYELALSLLSADSYCERYLAITWEGEYRLRVPIQTGTGGGVEYEVLPNTVVDIHSHGAMPAFFSATDNKDEQGLKLYMVVGKLNTLIPEVKLRIGVYGYFAQVDKSEVFE